MDFRELVRHYQSYDPASGLFDVRRMDKEYAALLGVHPTQLSRFYAGHVRDGRSILRAFLRTFPQAAREVCPALLQEEIALEADHAVA